MTPRTFQSRAASSDFGAVARLLNILGKVFFVANFCPPVAALVGTSGYLVGSLLVALTWLLAIARIGAAGSIEPDGRSVIVKRGPFVSRILQRDIASAWVASRADAEGT